MDRELASRADQRASRWLGHVERMDEYHQKCLDGGCKCIAGTGLTEVRLHGWREGGLGMERDDGGGCATMRERKEDREEGCRNPDAVGVNCRKSATNENQGAGTWYMG